MSERPTKFCQELWHKLGLYVDDKRAKGFSDAAIQRKLEQMESCGISCHGWKKRLEHRDTCIQVGVKEIELTQTETRKYRKLSNRDKKRVLQTFTDLQKNNSKNKPTRTLFKDAYRRVDPLILRVAVPKPKADASTILLSPEANFEPTTSAEGEKLPLPPFKWQIHKPTMTDIGLIDPSQIVKDKPLCLCAYCPDVFKCHYNAQPQEAKTIAAR